MFFKNIDQWQPKQLRIYWLIFNALYLSALIIFFCFLSIYFPTLSDNRIKQPQIPADLPGDGLRVFPVPRSPRFPRAGAPSQLRSAHDLPDQELLSPPDDDLCPQPDVFFHLYSFRIARRIMLAML